MHTHWLLEAGHLGHLTVDGDVNSQFLPEKFRQRATIPQIDPISNTAISLLVHRFAIDDPIEALRSGNRRGEPDLLVRRLLVQDVGADPGLVDSQDASLYRKDILAKL